MCKKAVCLLFLLIFTSLDPSLLFAGGSEPPETGVVLQSSVASQKEESLPAMARLAQRRDQAAIKGLKWMDQYLDHDEHFKSMPFEAYHFFHVCAQTSVNPELRSLAQKAADKYGARLLKHCLEMSDPLSRHDFLQVLELIGKQEYSRTDVAPLVAKAKKNYALFKNTVDIYGTPIDNLEKADQKAAFESLLYAYFLEKADTALPGEFKVDYRLADVLKYLKNRKFINFADISAEDKGPAVDDAFIITHVAYMISNYSSLRLREEDAPWLYDYLRRNFEDILSIGHIDLIGECVDVFRSLGYTEENNEIVRKGTNYLLAEQKPDGTWGEGGDNAYGTMHPTSCSIWALRERTFLQNTPYDLRMQSILRDLNRDKGK